MICYLMAILIVTISLTVFKIFIVRVGMTLTLSFRMGKVKRNHVDQKLIMTCYLVAVVILTYMIFIIKVIDLDLDL